jgi:hypothetical protein
MLDKVDARWRAEGIWPSERRKRLAGLLMQAKRQPYGWLEIELRRLIEGR